MSSIINRCTRTGMLVLAMLVSMGSGALHAQTPSSTPALPTEISAQEQLRATLMAKRAAVVARPIFKGKWQGPNEPEPLPGMNLPPDQLAAHFERLKTISRSPVRMKVLVLGGSRSFHHDAISTSMAAVYQWGAQSGLWDTEIKTDFNLINPRGGGPMYFGFQPVGLKDFDAIVIASAEGDWGLTEVQKKALLDFVRDQGKGLVVMHGGLSANGEWQDYLDMVGGESTGHPFNTIEKIIVNFPLVNEDTAFPAVAHWPRSFHKQDELYVMRNWSREDIHVLLRLDESRLDFIGVEKKTPPDRDMPVAWAKFYGKGRVFASSIGHSRESYEDPEVARMYSEAIKWALGLTNADIKPHPKR